MTKTFWQTWRGFVRRSRKSTTLGTRFGRLVVTGPMELRPPRHPYYLCRCDCGTEKSVYLHHLLRGKITSCGCRTREPNLSTTTHGQTNTPTWVSWMNMRARCQRETNQDYPKYGGRGIKVCERWQKFENFLADMGERPTLGRYTLDRINNDGDYEPGNCRWASAVEQNRNRRNTKMGEWAGMTMPLVEWCERAGVPHKLVVSRLKKGWPFPQALYIPKGENLW